MLHVRRLKSIFFEMTIIKLYYVEFEEGGKTFQICRSGDGFILRQASSVLILDNVSELKRYWNKNISPLPSIVKNQLSRIVDPVLYVQLFFVGQEGYIKHCQSRFL